MTNVIAFRVPSGSAAPRSAPRPDNSAKILFFTGVRYVRDEDDQPPPAPVAAVRKRRSVKAKAGGDERLQA